MEKKQFTFTEAQAQEFYAEHKDRSFFGDLVGFMTGGPVVGMILRKQNAIKAWRAFLGPTNSNTAREQAPQRCAPQAPPLQLSALA